MRHLKSELINNVDHMRISGPSSMILSQTKQFKKLKSDAQKVPKQAKVKRDGISVVIVLCCMMLQIM